MTLNTNERNEMARHLYERAGFAPQSEPVYGDGREICLVKSLEP